MVTLFPGGSICYLMHRKPKVKSDQDLIVWQRGVELVLETYRLTSAFPDTERYGLTSQMRRAAISIPSNIAEGCGRVSRKEMLQFIAVSRGSLRELETLILIARSLGFSACADCERAEGMALEIGKMLNGLRKALAPSRINDRAPRTKH